MPKILLFKWAYWRSWIDYRVASLSTWYQTAKGIIPESLKSTGQLYHTLINEKSYQLRTDRPYNYRKDSLLKIE